MTIAGLERLPAWLWRLLAIGLFSALSLGSLAQSSVVVDGVRYFWLDDDQMISMRYARNLADGHGLVWNSGERVEGYSNFLWTATMSAVHLSGLSDAKTSAAIKVVNWALGVWLLLLVELLLREFVPDPGLVLPAALIPMALGADVVYWSVCGYETTLLGVLVVLTALRILHESRNGRPRFLTCVLLGLLPLVRADALHLWAGLALLSLGLARHRWRMFGFLLVSLLPTVAHVGFRYQYYGDWLPNTYYLKIPGLSERLALGLHYLARFVRHYGIPLALAVGGLLLHRDRRRRLLCGGLAVSAAYVVWVGGDAFVYSRFLAPLIPVLLVVACAIIADATQASTPTRALLLLTLALSVVLQVGILRPTDLRYTNGRDGVPVVTGLLIREHSRPQATIAVTAAGIVPYFSRRYAFDMLGKSDPQIARLDPRVSRRIGHNKFDPLYSLGLRPDLVVSQMPHRATQAYAEDVLFERENFVAAIYGSEIFKRDYYPNTIPLPFLLERSALYLHAQSPERARADTWARPRIGSPD